MYGINKQGKRTAAQSAMPKAKALRSEAPREREPRAPPSVDHAAMIPRYIDFSVSRTVVVIDLTNLPAEPTGISRTVVRALWGAAPNNGDGVAVLAFAPNLSSSSSSSSSPLSLRCPDCNGPLGSVPQSSKQRFVVRWGPATESAHTRESIAAALLRGIITTPGGARRHSLFVPREMSAQLSRVAAGWHVECIQAFGDGAGMIIPPLDDVAESVQSIVGRQQQSPTGQLNAPSNEDAIGEAVACCKNWILAATAHGRPLPNSEKSLAHAIQNMCKVYRRVGTEAARGAIRTLAERGIVELCGLCNRPRFKQELPKVADARANVGTDGSAYLRVVEWLNGNVGLDRITSNAALLSHVASLSVVTAVSASSVVDSLVGCGMVVRNDGSSGITFVPDVVYREAAMKASSQSTTSASYGDATPCAEPGTPSRHSQLTPTPCFGDMRLFSDVIAGIESSELREPTDFQQRAMPVIIEGNHSRSDVVLQGNAGIGRATAAVICAVNATLKNTPYTQVIVLTPNERRTDELTALATSVGSVLGIRCAAVGHGGRLKQRSKQQPQLIVGQCRDVSVALNGRECHNAVLRMLVIVDADEIVTGNGSDDSIIEVASATFRMSNNPQVVITIEKDGLSAVSGVMSRLSNNPTVVSNDW